MRRGQRAACQGPPRGRGTAGRRRSSGRTGPGREDGAASCNCAGAKPSCRPGSRRSSPSRSSFLYLGHLQGLSSPRAFAHADPSACSAPSQLFLMSQLGCYPLALLSPPYPVPQRLLSITSLFTFLTALITTRNALDSILFSLLLSVSHQRGRGPGLSGPQLGPPYQEDGDSAQYSLAAVTGLSSPWITGPGGGDCWCRNHAKGKDFTAGELAPRYTSCASSQSALPLELPLRV